MIFVNLAVTDLAASRRFFEALGATNDPKFSDDTAAIMRFSDNIAFMLITYAKFASFTTREIIDPRRQVQVLLVLSRTDRASVDAAVDAGGTPRPDPDDGLWRAHVRSLDRLSHGHMFKLMWMDPAAFEQGADALKNA